MSIHLSSDVALRGEQGTQGLTILFLPLAILALSPILGGTLSGSGAGTTLRTRPKSAESANTHLMPHVASANNLETNAHYVRIHPRN